MRRFQGPAFVVPAIVALALVLGYPTLQAVLTSLRAGPVGAGYTVDHYAAVLGDGRFWNGLAVTLTFVGATVTLHLAAGMAVALALNTEIRARRLLRLVAIIPWTVPDVMSGLIWRFMYNPTSGVINAVLSRLGITDRRIEWLGDPDLALPSVIVADVWRGYPFVMLILLAGLQAVPTWQYEAAMVDGAAAWQRFRHVTLPNLRTVIIVAIVLDAVWQFRRFGLIFNMTQGGPGNETEILSLYVWKQYFKYFNFEYAAAVAVVLAAFMLVLFAPYVRSVLRRV